MASMKYCDKHNQVGFLKKLEESAGFAKIVDFLKGSHIRYALTHNPTVYDSLVKQFWQTVTALTLAIGTLELRATSDLLSFYNSIRHLFKQASIRRCFRKDFLLPNTEFLKGIWGILGQADQARTQSQPSSSTVPPPPTSQPAPTESPIIPLTHAPTHTHKAETWHMLVDDLFQLVPQLMTRIDSLEKDLKQTKQTMGNAIVKLVKKVKKMEKVVKSRRVVLTDSEDEGAENSSKQGRNLQKDESEVFETPKQGKSSGETDISPQGLEAAETLAEVLSQIKTKRRNVKTGVRRRLDAEDVSTGFEGFEDVSTGFTDIKSASEKVSSGGEYVSVLVKRRKGQFVRVLVRDSSTKRTKKQIREEQASLAEIARIQAEDEAKNARREELKRQDELAAKRLQEELELSEAQKKRMAQVQEAAQFYTEEDWDTIQAKLEANALFGQIDCRKKMYLRVGWWGVGENWLRLKKAYRWKNLNVKFEYLMKKHGIGFVPKGLQRKRKSLARKGVHKKLNSGTEEDVEPHTWRKGVAEPISEEFPMSLIPQGPTPAKIVKCPEAKRPLGKDFSNPFMADNLPKCVMVSTRHIIMFVKSWLAQQGYGLWLRLWGHSIYMVDCFQKTAMVLNLTNDSRSKVEWLLGTPVVIAMIPPKD
ncbi:hypothetical protein Tco_0964757 [Tanacetum coccineum]